MSIKIGNIDISYFKVGSGDCSIYLGDTLLYSGGTTPPTPPTPSYKWLATYDGGSTSSAECDASSAITENEISLTNLVEIEIGPCVTTIGNWAFYNCSSLTSCTIGSGVTSIGIYAFTSTTRKTVTVLATTPPTITTNYTRPFTKNYVTIYVPSELVDVYKTDTNWSYYASRIQAIPNS